jgi:hypothetical protein
MNTNGVIAVRASVDSPECGAPSIQPKKKKKTPLTISFGAIFLPTYFDIKDFNL